MHDGRERALSIGIRDRWQGRRDRPYVRAAGTWIAAGLLPDLAVQVADGDDLLAAALRQLDDGADLVKLYLNGPDPETAPWTADEVGRVVQAAHLLGEPGAGVIAEGGLADFSLVHGDPLTDATALWRVWRVAW